MSYLTNWYALQQLSCRSALTHRHQQASLNNDIVVSFVELASPSIMMMKQMFHKTAALKDFVGINFVEVDLSQADQHLQSIAVASGFVLGGVS